VIVENAELVRRLFEDLNEGNVKAMLARLAPEFEMVVPPGELAAPESSPTYEQAMEQEASFPFAHLHTREASEAGARG
jgi:ketosteroid isomerase-like protein